MSFHFRNSKDQCTLTPNKVFTFNVDNDLYMVSDVEELIQV